MSELWGPMSKMLQLPVVLTHSVSGCISSGQGDNLLFVKSGVTGPNCTSNTSSSLLQHLKPSYQATGGKKKSTVHPQHILSVTAHLCQLMDAIKIKMDHWVHNKTTIFKLHELPLSTLQYHLGREAAFHDWEVHCMPTCPHQTSATAEAMSWSTRASPRTGCATNPMPCLSGWDPGWFI